MKCTLLTNLLMSLHFYLIYTSRFLFLKDKHIWLRTILKLDNFLRLHSAAAMFVHVSRNPRVIDTCARYELGRGCKTTAEEYFSVVTSTLINCSNQQYMWIPISKKQSIFINNGGPGKLLCYHFNEPWSKSQQIQVLLLWEQACIASQPVGSSITFLVDVV
jgi:hypothetical protein